MSTRSLTRTLAVSFLLEATKPGGAAVSGTKPAYIRHLLNNGLIEPAGIVFQPYWPGSRGARAVQMFKATPKGHEKARGSSNG